VLRDLNGRQVPARIASAQPSPACPSCSVWLSHPPLPGHCAAAGRCMCAAGIRATTAAAGARQMGRCWGRWRGGRRAQAAHQAARSAPATGAPATTRLLAAAPGAVHPPTRTVRRPAVWVSALHCRAGLAPPGLSHLACHPVWPGHLEHCFLSLLLAVEELGEQGKTPSQQLSTPRIPGTAAANVFAMRLPVPHAYAGTGAWCTAAAHMSRLPLCCLLLALLPLL
jgi:hypothetical protein